MLEIKEILSFVADKMSCGFVFVLYPQNDERVFSVC